VDLLRVPLERPEKRSLSIAGHRTSIALEPSFWTALERIAERCGISLVRLIEAVDQTRAQRPDVSLAAALRLVALARDGGQGEAGTATADAPPTTVAGGGAAAGALRS